MSIIPYFGSNLTTGEYDELALSVISPALLKKEQTLFSSKWFDYRHLHPTQATYLYARHFTNESRKLYSSKRNSESGELFNVFQITPKAGEEAALEMIKEKQKQQRKAISELRKLKLTEAQLSKVDALEKAFKKKVCASNDAITDVMAGKDAATLWKGRQLADKIGMPYDVFIGTGIELLTSTYQWKGINPFTHMPRPKHLYSKAVESFMTEAWQAILDTGIVDPDMSRLSDDSSFSMQCKHDIERWLCEQLRRRKHPHFGISHYMFEKKIITEQCALQFFSSELIDKARRFHSE
ncbi:MAG: hypothetical protein ACXWT0_03950 [Methylobacter sp.]